MTPSIFDSRLRLRITGASIFCALVAYLWAGTPTSVYGQAPPKLKTPTGIVAGNFTGKERKEFVLPGNRPERETWLQDAGFGMFIHWSHDSQVGSVISHSVVGADEDYQKWFFEQLPKTFEPKEWDVDEVIKLAKICGMKYVVLTTKHHSGFCLWDTKTTDFNIMNTPCGKDIVAEYVKAVRKYDLAVGVYFSPEDFWWLRKYGHPVCRRGEEFLSPDEHEEYGKFIESQVEELFTNFGKIDMLFIDGKGEKTTKETCWRLQPDCLITRGEIATPEQYVPGKPPEGAWESNLTMGTQWQYKPTNDDYKSGTRIIELLIETRAKGGAMMMNIGPKPNGEIPIEQEARLREVALWRAVNHAAIQNTRPWVISNEEDIWFTRSKEEPNTVFAILTRVKDWERGGRREFLLSSVAATDQTEISVLGHGGKFAEYMPGLDVTPRLKQTDAGLEISVCRAQRLYNNHKWHNPVTVRLTNVKPAIKIPPYAATQPVTVTDDSSATLVGELVELAGAQNVEVGFEYQAYYGNAAAMHNTQWTATEMKPMSDKGQFSHKLTGLKPNTSYQFRAVVKHPVLKMRGDHVRFATQPKP